MPTEGQRAPRVREQESIVDRAPRVVTEQTNMEVAALAAKARSTDGDRRPAIEWPAPIINDVTGALADAGCTIERLKVTLNVALSELDNYVLPVADGAVEAAVFDAFCLMRSVEDELGDLMRVIGGIESAVLNERTARS